VAGSAPDAEGHYPYMAHPFSSSIIRKLGEYGEADLTSILLNQGENSPIKTSLSRCAEVMALAAVRRGGPEQRRRRSRGRSDRKEALRSPTDAGGRGADYERIARPRPDQDGGSPKNRKAGNEPNGDY